MTTILTTRTAHWVICRHRCFERNNRQIKTAGGTELQGQLQCASASFASYCELQVSFRQGWATSNGHEPHTEHTVIWRC